jgi:hypothetical protein
MDNPGPVGIAAFDLRDFDFPDPGCARRSKGECHRQRIRCSVANVDVNWFTKQKSKSSKFYFPVQ